MKRGITFDTAREIATALPGIEVGTAWGVQALKLRGRFLACMASHKSAEPNTLAVRMGFDQRDAMIADAPETYYLKPHYEGYPAVLVRLSHISRAALKDLLHAAWRFVDATAPKSKRPGTPRKRVAIQSGARRRR